MTAKEIARYLPYAPDNIEYKIITADEYKAIVSLARKYIDLCENIKDDQKKTAAEIAVMRDLLLPDRNGCPAGYPWCIPFD